MRGEAGLAEPVNPLAESGPQFSGKVALVTGGSRGIGRAVALELGRLGADVLVNFRKNESAALETVAAIRTLGGRAAAVRADMAKPEEIRRLFAELLEAFSGLDFLICCAAAGIQGTLQAMPLKAWDLAMNVNARAYLLCAQAASPLMQARGGGRIIALTTRAGTEQAGPLYGSIAASKAAINTLTAYMAVEFSPYNIIVNAVAPGLVATDSLMYFEAGAELLRRAEALTPTRRVTRVEDVAHLIAFLCSDGASQINGQVIEIDGGYRRLYL